MAADEGKRRVAAILAADVAGYSRLMADDERATVRTLTEYREVFAERIAAHEGRVVDTAGDSVLAVFDSVVEAVEAAVETQAVLGERNEALADHRRMYFRIGLNFGDIIERDDGTVYGDGVNVAARLEGLATPGGVMLSDDAHRYARGKASANFAEAGSHEVKNIAEPVKAWRVAAEGEVDSTPPTNRSRPAIMAGLVGALAIVIGVAIWQYTLPVGSPPMVAQDDTAPDAAMIPGAAIASVAVLPFDDLSASAEYAFLAAGLHENIIASLSQARRLFVPARFSTLQYEDADRNIAEVAQTLGVGHVLEGSIQVSGDTVRIVMQLIDASTGGHVWAERYDRPLDNVFALQDDIAFNVVTALQVELTEGPQLLRWRGGTRSLEAWAKYQEGVIELRKFTEAGVANAIALLSEAVHIDPNFALAWAYRGWAVAQRYGFGFTDDETALSDSLKDADRALEIDQFLSVAYALKARVHHIRHEFADAVAMGARSIELDPNGSLARAAHSEKLVAVGRPQDALAMLGEAMRLMPVYPDWYLWDMAHALLLLGRHGEASDVFLDYHRRQPGDPDRALTLVALSRAGRLDEARSVLARITAADPDFSIERVRRLHERTTPYSDPAILEAHLTTLRELGVPEQPPDSSSMPVIAVLPFENMSGDAEQGYFADGITEDIITALTRFPDLSVIGRTRMFRYKGRTPDIAVVHDETGAAYIVEGSVRRDQNMIRITAQITDVNSGALLWSDNYQRDLEAGGIFHIQDDIMQQVVGSVAGQYGALTSAQARGSVAASIRSLGARECVYRGHQYFRELRWEDHAAMRDCLEQATETDPTYADAWALLASIYAEEHSFDLDPRPNPLDRALAAAQQAVEHDSSSTLAQQALAEARFYRHEKDLLMAAAETAQSLNPNDSGLLMTLGFYVAYAGEWEQGAKLIRDGVALNANLPTWYHYPLFYKAMGEHDYEAALAEARQFNAPDAFWTPAAFAAAYAHLGRMEEARASIERLLELYPDFSEHAYAEYRKWIFDEAVVEHSIDGLRKAGLEIPSL
jgi:adenylate cyclase